MLNRTAGLIFGPLEHHLDHLAVFCSLMEVPLVVTEEKLFQKAQLYYPHLEVLYWDPLEAPFEVVRSFETIFYSTPRVLFDEIFFIAERTFGKKINTVWLPHGNSDKGHASLFMEGLKNETAILVYGPKMIDFLKTKQVFEKMPRSVEVGNFRLEYYRRHRAFYNSWIEKLSLPDKKIILYAPTWQDGEKSSSFFHEAERLIQQLPSTNYLLIKLHPNLEIDIRTEQLKLQYESHPNIRFLSGFTPVYPILEKAHLYIGDMSSIGYDFLTFNRPMFFFNPLLRASSDPGLYLHQCGRTFDPDSPIFDTISLDGDQSHLTEVRSATYAYTFGKDRPWEETHGEILEILR